MAKSALWRITSVDTRGQDLVLSRLRLLASSTRVDSGAVLTCTAAPVSGALADLLDDSAASCRFAAADVSAPGFQIVFTLPAEQEVDGVELGLVSVPVSPVALALEFLADGIYTVRSDFRGVETAGAPKIQQVGEVIAGTPQQGYIVALRAGSAYPEYNAFDQGAATWAGNFGQTIDIGLFANAGTNPGDTGVQPQKTINQFSIHDTWNLSSLNGFYNGDIANLDIEFLRNDGGVVAAIRLKRGAEYSTDMFFGASLGALTKASQTGTFGWPSGDITFKSQAMAWMPSAANSNNHAAWSYPAQMSEVTSVRFSNARAMSNYGGAGAAFVAIRRMPIWVREGYTGELPYRSTSAAALNVVCSAETIAQNSSLMQALGTVKFLDAEFGGRGFIYGVVKEHETQRLLQRRVRLFRSRDGYLVREVWSAADGSYRFEGINERYEYDIEAWDHEKNYFSAVANNQIPEVVA